MSLKRFSTCSVSGSLVTMLFYSNPFPISAYQVGRYFRHAGIMQCTHFLRLPEQSTTKCRLKTTESQIWRLEVRIMLPLCSLQGLKGRLLPCLCWLQVFAGEPWHSSPSRCIVPTSASSLTFSCGSLLLL